MTRQLNVDYTTNKIEYCRYNETKEIVSEYYKNGFE